MNRLLTEGRRAFLRRVSGIQRGAECARYEPLLSALADGEATAEQLAELRPHMKTCLSCRAALREFLAMPDRVASVVPLAALGSGEGGGTLRDMAESALAAAQQKLESALGAVQHKTAAMGERLHAAAELATGQKVAAVAASAAALAGGGTAVHGLSDGKRQLRPAQVQNQPGDTPKEAAPVEAPAIPVLPPSTEGAAPETPPPTSPPEPRPPASEPEPEPAREFMPTPAPEPAAAEPMSRAGEFGGPGGGEPTGAGGEFAP